MNLITVLFKKWLENSDIEMYSSQNEENSVVAEGFMGIKKKTNFISI